MSASTISDEDYLTQYKIGEKKYLVGVYQDGITIHKQQIRALNIFHALIKTGTLKIGQIKPDKTQTIGIIGGGAAGLTIAAAALKAKFNVVLLEKQARLMPIQHGCRRKIHPRIYDWPDANSLIPFGKLPLLDWTYDEAGNVAEQVIGKFREIQEQLVSQGTFLYTEHLNCSDFSVQNLSNGQVQLRPATPEKKNFAQGYGPSYNCDVVLYAVGFGLEKNEPGYWRNDDIDQTNLKDYTDFIVSGVGDGGMTDALRLLISGYSYEYIVKILQADSRYEKLREKLTIAKANTFKESNRKGVLFSEFEEINASYYEYIFDAIERDKGFRKSSRVHLHSRDLDFQEILDLKKASLLTTFLIFIFRKRGDLEFLKGNLIPKGSGYTLDGKGLASYLKPRAKYKLFRRYGTNRDEMVSRIVLDVSEIADRKSTMESLKKQQRKNDTGLVEPRWNYNDIYNPCEANKRYAFCSSASDDVCARYAALLHNTISANVRKSLKFRLTIHRVIELNGTRYFQQITPYYGYGNDIDNKINLGRVFPINRGNVGLSIKTGKPILITRKDTVNFKKMVKQLNLEHIYDKIKKTSSFFTLPIVAPISGNRIATNLVLYIDCLNSINFFAEKSIKEKNRDVLDIIFNVTDEFVNQVNSQVYLSDSSYSNAKSAIKKIYMCELDFVPQPIPRKVELTDFVGNSCFEVPDKIKSLSKPFKFKEFYSFDTSVMKSDVF